MSTLWYLLLFVNAACGAKILINFLPMTSHCLEMVSIGNELVRRGHSVAVYLPDFYDSSYCFRGSKINIIQFKVTATNKARFEASVTGLEKNIVTREKGFLQLMAELGDSINAMCETLLSNREGLEQLKKEKYDIVMTDSLPFCRCYYLVAYFLEVPTASISSYIVEYDSGSVFQPATYPHAFGSYTNKMSYFQRILNTFQYVAFAYMFPLFRGSFDASKYGEPFTNVDPEDLIRYSAVYLENSDYIADYPKAVFPNFVQVGGVTTKPPDPLPNDLKTFLDNSKNGVIVISFGSILKHADPVLLEGIMKALKRLKFDVLFKLETNEQKGNVKIVNWLPQNDVLGHKNIKLFVSHCGRNSFFEALYHAVPIVCTPLNGDAFQTALKVVHHEIGASLDLLSADSDKVFHVLDFVLTNTTVRENMRKMSVLFRDRPETPSQRAASAIEHVIKYGSDHLAPSTNRLNFLQYTLSDVWVVIFMIELLLVCGLCRLVRCICCRKSAGANKTKSD